MKVLLTIEGGFAKTIYEGDKKEVTNFVAGVHYARGKNLSSSEVIDVLNHMVSLSKTPAYPAWAKGVLSAMENKVGKLEVIE